MRGRIWACWIVMSLEGVFCMLMASVSKFVSSLVSWYVSVCVC